MSYPARFFWSAAVLGILALAACDGPIVKEASYPTKQKGTDKILYSDQKRETIWGDNGETLSDKLFNKDDDGKATGAGIGVNSFLWRASLDTVAFMPIVSADPFGGVILTDWYENPGAAGERFKINVYILDKQLRADGLRVSIFKQKQEGGQWRDTTVPDEMTTSIENTILTRARDLRVAQLGINKKN